VKPSENSSNQPKRSAIAGEGFGLKVAANGGNGLRSEAGKFCWRQPLALSYEGRGG
jgi:hypothetical protein